jgi:TonB family protein
MDNPQESVEPIQLTKLENAPAAIKTGSRPIVAENALARAKDPEITRLEQPRLPVGAFQSSASEEVTVSVQVGPEGKPLQAKVIKSTNNLLNEAVIEAVMQSEYSAGSTSSGPVTKWITIPFKFKP